MATLTDEDRRVLACLDDMWVMVYNLMGGDYDHRLTERQLVGRLQSLRRRGFVDHRPPEDSEFKSVWAITPKGDVVNHGPEVLTYYQCGADQLNDGHH